MASSDRAAVGASAADRMPAAPGARVGSAGGPQAAAAAHPDQAWRTRLAAGLPRRLLEVSCLDGQIDIMEHYGDGDAERLVQALTRLGLRARRRFHSPCG